MRVGRYNFSVESEHARRERLAAAKKASSSIPSSQQRTGKVDTYASVSSKTFGNYKTSAGDVSINYTIVEGLYRKTIMRKVIDKTAGDATRLGYSLVYTDMNGNPHEQAEQIGKDIDRMLKRQVMKQAYRDREVYGDAFLYKQVGPSTTGLCNVQDIYGINPQNITPVESNGVLTGWQYQSASKGQQVDLGLEEVIHIPRDPLTGQLFGNSIFESVLQVLNLILNCQLNTAVVLDHYAIPLIHWLIDSKHDRRKTPLSEITAFINKLKKMTTGTDLVTDSSITHEVVGGEQTMIDFTTMLDKLDSYFFATCGVPGQILGMNADNLSAITRQLQTYYENIFDIQLSVADCLIEQLYWPEMINAGIDDLYSIDVVTNKPLVEQESRVMTWVKDALALNIIDLPQARKIMGIGGAPPTESNNLEWILGTPPVTDANGNVINGQGTGTATNDPQYDKKQNQETPAGTNPGGNGQ